MQINGYFFNFLHFRNLQKLIINETLNTAAKLQIALIVAEVSLSDLHKDTPYESLELR